MFSSPILVFDDNYYTRLLVFEDINYNLLPVFEDISIIFYYLYLKNILYKAVFQLLDLIIS